MKTLNTNSLTFYLTVTVYSTDCNSTLCNVFTSCRHDSTSFLSAYELGYANDQHRSSVWPSAPRIYGQPGTTALDDSAFNNQPRSIGCWGAFNRPRLKIRWRKVLNIDVEPSTFWGHPKTPRHFLCIEGSKMNHAVDSNTRCCLELEHVYTHILDISQIWNLFSFANAVLSFIQ